MNHLQTSNGADPSYHQVDAGDAFVLTKAFACRTSFESAEVLRAGAPNPEQVRRLVIFEAPDLSGSLRSICSIGLSVNEERLYADLALDLNTPISVCRTSGKAHVGPLERLNRDCEGWAKYHDGEFTEGELFAAHVGLWPLKVFDVSVGVLFLVVVGSDVDHTLSYFERLSAMLGPFVASRGYCRMWDATLGGTVPSRLTTRDRQILLRVEEGLSNHQIATQLTAKLDHPVSESTVRNSLTRIYKRLGASDRRDAAKKARLRGDLAGLR